VVRDAKKLQADLERTARGFDAGSSGSGWRGQGSMRSTPEGRRRRARGRLES
jgi:hypothetical protein